MTAPAMAACFRARAAWARHDHQTSLDFEALTERGTESLMRDPSGAREVETDFGTLGLSPTVAAPRSVNAPPTLDGQPTSAPPDASPPGLPVEGRVPPAEPNGCGRPTAAAATARADTGGVHDTTRPSPDRRPPEVGPSHGCAVAQADPAACGGAE